MNILISTFNNWQILPELVAFVAPENYGLYTRQYNRRDPERLREIDRNREDYRVAEPDEMWLICTAGVQKSSISRWEQWHADHPFIPFRRFELAGMNDIHTLHDSRKMRELILRVTLLAHLRCRPSGRLLISLAGGRKTMSSDMQFAAGFFGCDALIHVAATGPLDDRVFFHEKETSPDFNVMPFVTDRFQEHPAAGTLQPANYPVEFPETNSHRSIEINNTPLLESVEELYNTSGNFYVNYNDPDHEKHRSGFTVLFSLSRSRFRELESYRINSQTRYETVSAFLNALPKTDLHCHLGGVLFPEQIIEIARTWEDEIESWLIKSDDLNTFHDTCLEASRAGSLAPLPRLLMEKGIREYHRSLFETKGVPRHILSSACALAFSSNPGLFKELVYGNLLEEGKFNGIGINRYEQLGDFQGSSLLQSRESIEKTVDLLCLNALEDNVRYLELRCSPHKYTAAGLREKEVYDIIERRLREQSDRIITRIIIIASRHGEEGEIRKAVDLALEVSEEPDSLLAGIDLAGDEAARRPAQVRTLFLPLLEKCMGVTIHAGETMPSQSIWEAVYHLSAERIGHGLTLVERQDLLTKVRDRRIGVELCPSSNMQIAGYRYGREERDMNYPLREFLDQELRVSVSTDNPGISLTTPGRELYKAALLTPGGLTLLDILQLVKNGISSSFLSHSEKKNVMFSFENEIIQLLTGKDIL